MVNDCQYVFPFLFFYFIAESPFLRIHYILSNSISLPVLINTPPPLKIVISGKGYPSHTGEGQHI